MAYNNIDFDKDIEMALRMQSGFQGPIVEPSYVVEGPSYRNEPGYAQEQAALARPGQMRRGVAELPSDIEAMDRYLFGQRVKQMEGGWGGREAAVDYAIRAGREDIGRREADRQARLKEDLFVASEMAKTGKMQAESAKAQAEGEAELAMAGRPKNPWAGAVMAAGPRVAGEAESDYAKRIGTESAAQYGQRQEITSRIPTPAIREKIGVLEGTLQGLSQLQQEHQPVFTGQEAPMNKMGKYLGMENPAFARFRARAQSIYAPARNELIGATQSPQELESINRVLPPDITQLSDIEAVEAMRVLSEQTNMKLNNLKHQFRGSQPTPGIIASQGGAPKVGDRKTFPNGAVGEYDGTGWRKVS